MRPLRLLLLTEIPAPFRIPLFNSLAREPDVELEVLFLSEQDPKRPYPVYADEFKFGWRILSGFGIVVKGRWIVFNRAVFRAIRHRRPSVIVIGGWNQPAFWVGAIYAHLTRIPLVGWVESTARDNRLERLVTEVPKRILVHSCDAFLVPGRASAEYLRSLGIDAKLIEQAPNAVDIQIFGDAVAEARRDLAGLRNSLGLTRCTFLYVGRLDPEKGVDLLVEAFRTLAADLVIVGNGSESARLARVTPANVRLVGRLERDDLVPWYAAADAFVLPSRSDQWGMVLNEAATAGLPLVSTDAPGAAHDLIEEGVNGFRVPVGDLRALTKALARVTDDPQFRQAAGRRSAEIATRFTPAAWADAVGSVVRRLVA